MTTSQETQAREILQKFINDIPDYILEDALALAGSGGIQKVDVKKRDDFWDIHGQVQGDDFQVYSSELALNLRDRVLNSYCNCPESFTGICRHVGATALKVVKSFESEQDAPVHKPRVDWRQNFRAFFATELEPEPGNHYVVYRFHPEPGRLQVAFFRGRQNKSGLSQVQHEITLEQLIKNPDWCETAPMLPGIARQIGMHQDYYGHRVDLPAGLLSWFFWAIRSEYYLFFKDTDQPMRIESQTMQLKLSPQLSEDGLSFDLLLARSGKPPFSITGQEVFFYGRLPLWVLLEAGLLPGADRAGLRTHPGDGGAAAHHPPRGHLGIHRPGLDPHFRLRPARPGGLPGAHGPHLRPGHLPPQALPGRGREPAHAQGPEHLRDRAHGGGAPRPPTRTSRPAATTTSKSPISSAAPRDAETALITELTEMGFAQRNNANWFMEQEAAINFLLDHYPRLVETYRVYGEQNLTRYKVRLSKPVIVAEVESDEENKWFNLDLAVQYDDHKVPIEEIWKAWVQGKRYVQLKDGSYTSLPESWLQKLGHKLKAMGYDPEKPPQKQFKQFEAPALDNLLDDLPNVRTDAYFVKLKEKIGNFKEIRRSTRPRGSPPRCGPTRSRV